VSQVADRYRTLSEAFEQRVRAVSPDQWAAPSPCEGWTARDVVRHVVDVHGMMLGFIGRTLSPAPGVDQDPAAALHAARADVQAVLDDPAIATTEYDGLLGRTTIEATIDRFLCLDLVIHGWDLARATGQDERLDPAEVERIFNDARALGDNLRRAFGPPVEVDDGASEQDRLLAYLGRDPR